MRGVREMVLWLYLLINVYYLPLVANSAVVTYPIELLSNIHLIVTFISCCHIYTCYCQIYLRLTHLIVTFTSCSQIHMLLSHTHFLVSKFTSYCQQTHNLIVTNHFLLSENQTLRWLHLQTIHKQINTLVGIIE